MTAQVMAEAIYARTYDRARGAPAPSRRMVRNDAATLVALAADVHAACAAVVAGMIHATTAELDAALPVPRHGWRLVTRATAPGELWLDGAPLRRGWRWHARVEHAGTCTRWDGYGPDERTARRRLGRTLRRRLRIYQAHLARGTAP